MRQQLSLLAIATILVISSNASYAVDPRCGDRANHGVCNDEDGVYCDAVINKLYVCHTVYGSGNHPDCLTKVTGWSCIAP